MLNVVKWFAILALFLAAPANAAPVKVAIFDFELIDTSLEGEVTGARADQQRRLGLVADQLRAAVAAAPGFAVVDIAPVAEKARGENLQNCGGCDRTFAGELGAGWSITGTVQKVSNLILNINIYVRDVETGKLTQVMSADIRSNTDESWRRGMAWLIKNRLKLVP